MGKKFSLTNVYPEIAKEWHPTKNGTLRPTDVIAGSHKKVWWVCNKGHEWLATIHNRTAAGTKCPYCSNKKVLSGLRSQWLLVILHFFLYLIIFISSANTIPQK